MPLWLDLRNQNFSPTGLLSWFSVTDAPVPVFEIAAELEVPVIPVDNAAITWLAAARFTTAEAHIWVHERDQEPCQRFYQCCRQNRPWKPTEGRTFLLRAVGRCFMLPIRVAWLSDATTDAKNRLAGARNWWRVDMLPFADQVNDVINARILYPPRIDEHGVDHPAATVLTATGADGVKVIDDDLGTCADWSEIGGGSATGGISDAGDELWTDWRALPVDCDTAQHLYCFGVDNDAPMELTPAVGRAAFVSRDVFLPQLGLDTADAQCQQEAVQAGLQGQFLALLATTMVGAADRFDLQGEPWVRADGVGVVAQAVQLGTGTLLAPLVLDAEGLPVASSPVWTGATGVAMVSEDESCLDWSDLGSIGRIGMSSRSAPGWFDSGTTTCDQENGRLYCLEQ
jgi:hypothetical protein